MKDRVGRQRNLMPTSCALPASLLCQFVGMSVPAARTHEAVRPPTSGQILPAGLFARKICLKFAQSLRKRRPRHPTTLQLVACLNNRISRSKLRHRKMYTNNAEEESSGGGTGSPRRPKEGAEGS